MKAYRGWKIHYSLYDSNGCIIDSSCKSGRILPNYIYTTLLQKWNSEKNPVTIFEENTIGYMGFAIGEQFAVLGPAAFRQVQRKELWTYCQKRNISITNEKVPYVPLKQMLSCLSTISYLCTGIYIDEEELERNVMDIVEENCEPEQLSWDEEKLETYGYDKEKDYKENAANGTIKVDDTVLMHGISEVDRIGLEAVHPTKKRYEYMVLIAIIYAGEACFEAGVPYYRRQKLQETYMGKLSECKNEIEILQVYGEAANRFNAMASEYKERMGGGYVEQCKNYIGRNIRKKLTVEKIAKALNVSESYLSRKFSEEEGIPLKRYLLQERIKLSQNLLKNTQETIGTISDYLNFHSQSYFTQMFKEVTGITPAEYRKRNQITK